MYYNLGNAFCVQSKFEESVEAYERAIKLDEKNAAAYYNFGNALYFLEKFDDAIESFDQAIKLNPNEDFLYFCRGKAHRKIDNFVKAEEDFQKAIKINPLNSDYSNYLDDLFKRKQRFTRRCFFRSQKF